MFDSAGVPLLLNGYGIWRCLCRNGFFCLSFSSSLQTGQHGTKRLEPSSAKSLMDIGTRRIFSSDHDIFRESARKFFQEEVLPFHAE